MKKYMGIYTNEAAKALKGSERIICRVTDDGRSMLPTALSPIR